MLGPRDGALEKLPLAKDPRNEYTTGQLFPFAAPTERTPEEDQGLGTGIQSSEDDSEDDSPTTFVNQAMIDSGQNFRRIPSSMGISFVLDRTPKTGDIEVCATWARYSLASESWERRPMSFLDLYDSEDLQHASPDGSITISYKLTKLRDQRVKVSIYLASAIMLEPGERVGSDQIIFQPELRVLLKQPDSLAELGDLGFLTDDDEWRISTRQYDKLGVFARGHLCGVYWKEIDPQRPFSGVTGVIDTPFVWVDGDHLCSKNPDIERFRHPDLRTEFIPLYSAPAPKVDKGMLEKLDLKADKISSSSSFLELEKNLSPLVQAYEKWINELKPGTDSQNTDREIIKRHSVALNRIKAGLNFLKVDSTALESFLFMNKAMSIQYKWGRTPGDDVMRWHPFQLAFILLSIESTAKQESLDRGVCDTIWFPTGGGKTEAYLGLAAFSLAYRRRSATTESSGAGEGTGVISRYTLRLLTIQQFRRALKMIMACELLRCRDNGDDTVGWIPNTKMQANEHTWGRTPFSIGLWVGAKVTPNLMAGNGWGDISPGAIALLKRSASLDASDPAQAISCPCCSSMLSLPVDGVGKGQATLKLVVSSRPTISDQTIPALTTNKIEVASLDYSPHASGRCGYLKISMSLKQSVMPGEFVRWWQDRGEAALGVQIQSFSIARPGYFPIESGRRGTVKDYEIRCPNADCSLNTQTYRAMEPVSDQEWAYSTVHPLFQSPSSEFVGVGIPIKALTVDEKLYSDPPSMLISTCDKLAMSAFSNSAASLFGRVRSYGVDGYSQEPANRNRFEVQNFLQPDLIIQDELHLLEGPLGSSFGLFETVVSKLCGNPKYIASSATIRNSIEQVASLTGRDSRVFPPVGLDISNGFFLRSEEAHQLDESGPGRLFLGLAFPGRAPQTPMLRTWGKLLQTAQSLLDEGCSEEEVDPFWTLVGYFNAVRELAQGETLLRQDIPQFLDELHRRNPTGNRRPLPWDGSKNLSSQTNSSELPGILATMEKTLDKGESLNTVSATSMFGTGVDVSRLSLMIVHGQPKSASQYIQAVGRIGRKRAGLAVVFFRVSKPRDLNHYEYFTGYHRKLPVAVEPITVKPLAPKAIDNMLGSLLASLIRNWRDESIPFPMGIDSNEGAAAIRELSPEAMSELMECFGRKWDQQPEERKPPGGRDFFLDQVRSQIERWQEYARRRLADGLALHYTSKDEFCVLGSDDTSASVFPNTPKSLREVEPTISIYTRAD